MTEKDPRFGLIETFRIILKGLPSRRRKQFWLIFAMMLFFAGLETVTVGFIALFASAVTDPQVVLNSSYWDIIQKNIHLDYLTNPRGLVIFLSIAVVGFVILKNLIQSLVVYWSSLFASLVNGYWGEMLLNGFMRMPYVWHLRRNSADLILAILWRSHVGHGFINGVLTVFCDTLIVSFMIISILVVDPLISLLMLLSLGGVGYFIYSNVRVTLDNTADKVSKYDRGTNMQATKALHGIKDVRIFGQERSFLKDFERDVSALAWLWAKLTFLGRSPVMVLEVVGFVMLTCAIAFMLFISGATSAKITGTIALLAAVAWRVLPALNRILGGFTEMRRSLPFVGRLIEYYHEMVSKSEYEYLPSFDDKAVFEFQKDIQFQNVYFSYDGNGSYQLRDVSLFIPKGKTVGIIGRSGAGKSTIVDILIGLLPPTRGSVLIDGEVLDNERRISWMHIIGYVPQTPYIFDGTLAENVAFGLNSNEINRKRVLDCCKMAAIDFLKDLPNDIDTLIGERGMRLSGGQRQRVSIARALYHNPEALIFDEATSSLDSNSERAIQNTIYSFKGKQTLIIIAHRLSTVEACDFLIWLENGKVKKIGPPAEILPIYDDANDGMEKLNQN